MRTRFVELGMDDLSHNSSGHFLSEPLFGLIGGDSLVLSELSVGVLSLANSLSSSGEDHVEVHTENTGIGIVFDSEINVLIDTESEVTYLI
jgi:hypothetical protein